MIKTYKYIYIICPLYARSGGAEALHQLSHYLRIKNINCYLIYYNYKRHTTHESYTPIKFRHYSKKIVKNIKDEKSNLVIFPESMADLVFKFVNVDKAIWWLSVNYGKWSESLKSNEIQHYYQSHYAKEYLLKMGIVNLKPLSDFIQHSFRFIKFNRKNIIVYDPRKVNSTFSKVEKLISQRKDIEFVEITNLDQIRLTKLLSQAKLYFDLGDNPGKDRLPREAAYFGCLIMLLKKGSANNDIDTPIKTMYKIDLETSSNQIAQTIISYLDNYDKLIQNNFAFKKSILNERIIFEKEIDDVFGTQKIENNYWTIPYQIKYLYNAIFDFILHSGFHSYKIKKRS